MDSIRKAYLDMLSEQVELDEAKGDIRKAIGAVALAAGAVSGLNYMSKSDVAPKPQASASVSGNIIQPIQKSEKELRADKIYDILTNKLTDIRQKHNPKI